MKSLILVGGGGHCKAVIDVIEAGGIFQIAGIIDKPSLLGSQVLGYDVIGTDDDLPELRKKYDYALVTVGQIKTPNIRMNLFAQLKALGFTLPTIVSPRSYVSKHAEVGEGSVIMHDAMVNVGVEIKRNCIINSKALIEHDAKVGDHCHISTSVTLNGSVTVEQGSFVGSGAVTREGVVISKMSFIKAGSLVK